jgi:hypothetical protein
MQLRWRTAAAYEQDPSHMPLRHSKSPLPRWVEACAGPFMALLGFFFAIVILLTKPLTFGNAISFVLTLSLGVWLTIDRIRNK